MQSWDSFFRNSTAGAAPGLAYQAPPSLAPSHNQVPLGALLPLAGSQIGQSPLNEKIIDDHLAVQAIIRSYQVRECCELFCSLRLLHYEHYYFIAINKNFVCFLENYIEFEQG